MSTAEDLLYLDNLKGKKYMMGVSPWFYTSEFPFCALLPKRYF